MGITVSTLMHKGTPVAAREAKCHMALRMPSPLKYKTGQIAVDYSYGNANIPIE